VTNPVGDCFLRLSDAVGGTDTTADERTRVLDGWLAAGGEESATWEKLSPDVRALVEELEKREAQSWPDPADLPEQQNI
jgi:hypothetical protein